MLRWKGAAMEIDWARHIVIGLISAMGVFAITSWASKSPPGKQGSRSIKPGGT